MENFKLTVGVMGDDGRDPKRGKWEMPITHKNMVNWIKNRGYDPATEKRLIQIISGYPCSSFAYKQFIKNIDNYVRSVQKELKESNSNNTGEKNDISDQKEENHQKEGDSQSSKT